MVVIQTRQNIDWDLSERRTMPKKWRTLHKTPFNGIIMPNNYNTSVFTHRFLIWFFFLLFWFVCIDLACMHISLCWKPRDHKNQVNHAISSDLKNENVNIHFIIMHFLLNFSDSLSGSLFFPPQCFVRWIADNELKWSGYMKRHCELAGEIIEIRLLIYWAWSDTARYWKP